MKGYDVVRSDGRRIGRVADAFGDYVIVELGRVVRTRRVLPTEFVHAADRERKIVVTASTARLEAAPRAARSGRFDAAAAARHFGTA